MGCFRSRWECTALAACLLLVYCSHCVAGKARPYQPLVPYEPVLEHNTLRYWGDGDGITGGWTGFHYTALCTVAKDEADDICEWLQYHEQVVGVGFFYILDNGSHEPMINKIRECFDVKKIRYLYFHRPFRTLFNRETRPQLWGYQECLLNFGHQHRWMGFIDVDEFIVVKDSPSGDWNTLLQDYEGYPGLVLNWRMFGSSGHIMRPKGGVLKNYLSALPSSRKVHNLVKTIANTAYVTKPGRDPHHFIYQDGLHPVTADLERVSGPRSHNISHSKVLLHHYVLKSAMEYGKKEARGSAMGNRKADEFFSTIDRMATHRDETAALLAEQIDPDKYRHKPLDLHFASHALPV